MAAMKRPLLLGHRGSPRAHRENTLLSFQAALNAGLDGVELDVRRCADGTLVVHHDEKLFDGRRIAELTPAQLAPHPIATLSEVCAWAADTGAYLNVEIKYERLLPDDRVKGTAELLRRFGLTEQTIVSSFNPLLLAALRAVAPEIGRGLLFDRAPRSMPLIAAQLKVSALHPHRSLVTPELMDLARKQAWRVNVWTVNEAAEGRRLLELGADGLIGDFPDKLLRASRPENDENLTQAS